MQKMSFLGPLASIGCNQLGARYTVIFGGMLISGGIFASAFPPSLYYMYVTYGVLSGNVNFLNYFLKQFFYNILPLKFTNKT